jgi:hypothetical protein
VDAAATDTHVHALWRRNDELPALERALSAISDIAAREHWL